MSRPIVPFIYMNLRKNIISFHYLGIYVLFSLCFSLTMRSGAPSVINSARWASSIQPQIHRYTVRIVFKASHHGAIMKGCKYSPIVCAI